MRIIHGPANAAVFFSRYAGAHITPDDYGAVAALASWHGDWTRAPIQRAASFRSMQPTAGSRFGDGALPEDRAVGAEARRQLIDELEKLAAATTRTSRREGDEAMDAQRGELLDRGRIEREPGVRCHRDLELR
jgi:hypothetical protein